MHVRYGAGPPVGGQALQLAGRPSSWRAGPPVGGQVYLPWAGIRGASWNLIELHLLLDTV